MAALIATARRNPAKQARGRRVVLWMAGLFVAAQGLAGYLIDRHGFAIRFPSGEAVLRDAGESPRATIVWMGTSRSERGVRPDVMNTALWERYGRHRVNLFNAAVPVGDPITSEYLLDAFLARGHRPEILVVEVSPDLLTRNSHWVGVHVMREMGWSDVPAVLPEAAGSDNLARLVTARLMPLYSHRKELRNLVLTSQTSEPPPLASPRCWAKGYFRWGHFDDYPEPPASPEFGRRRMDFDSMGVSRQLRDYRADGVVSAALGRLLSRCDAEGISVVLVLPAVSEALRDLYTPEVERRFRDELARMRESHPFEVVDLRDTVPDAGFVNVYHLVPETGGLTYSRAALERVVIPAVERRGLTASR